MTEHQIIDMALKTGLAFDSDEYPDIWQTYMDVGQKEIMAFAKLVAEFERANNALLCYEQRKHWDALACADAIRAGTRARGQA